MFHISDYLMMSKRYPKVILITLVRGNYPVCGNIGGNCIKLGISAVSVILRVPFLRYFENSRRRRCAAGF